MERERGGGGERERQEKIVSERERERESTALKEALQKSSPQTWKGGDRERVCVCV